MRYKTNPSQRGHPDLAADNLSKALGGFSIALGVSEIVCAKRLARTLGLQDYEWLVRLYGVREIATGTGIFLSRDSTPWIWGRVAGDVLDVGTVGVGRARQVKKHRAGFLITLASLAGALALDAYCAMRLSRGSKQPLPHAAGAA